MSPDPPRIAVLAHGQFPDRAKTAVGILRYGKQQVVGVLDRATAGDRVSDHVAGVQDAPIVESMADAPDCDALVIGIAPIGGGFDESWRPDVEEALLRGCDVVSGLHAFLSEDDEFVRLAAENDCDLRDVRQPPDTLSVADGSAEEVAADVVLTVGTDCSTGKMTTTMELARAAHDRGIDAAVVPTGQTGILIEGWGIAVDRVIADFAAGAVERLIVDAGTDHDLLFVEGQGSIIHPAYSGVTASIIHGARPDAFVLCHVAGRETIHGYESTPIPPIDDVASFYESFAKPVTKTSVVGGSLATHAIETEDTASAAIETYRDSLGVPATDPVRFGPDEILTAVLEEAT